MNLYIEENLKINRIFQRFTAEEDIQPYSIDESLLDITASWHLFGQTPYEVARQIQLTVKKETGIYLTVGIGDNPLLAKLALDLEAKHNHSLIAEWHYEDIPDKLWPVTDLARVWSIGQRTATKLNQLQIHSMGDLAHTNPYDLKQKMGIIGSQLFAFSWGIDRAIVHQKYTPKERSYGNSQVLPRDYFLQTEIEVVIREIAEQVAARLRAHRKQACMISLGIGFSFSENESGVHSGFGRSLKIEPTNGNHEITTTAIQLFREQWQHQTIRHISLTCGQLIDDDVQQLDLFDPQLRHLKQHQLDQTVDEIRQKFGFASLVKLSVRIRVQPRLNGPDLLVVMRAAMLMTKRFDNKLVTQFLKHDYHDRGMMKWQGFYLSDHTSYVPRKRASLTCSCTEHILLRCLLNRLVR